MFWWLAQNTLIAAILALAVSLACRWLRFSPAVRHALWLVVLLKLITPPVACYSLPPFKLWPSFFFEPSSYPSENEPAGEVALDSRSSTDERVVVVADVEILSDHPSPDEMAATVGEPDQSPPDDQMLDGAETRIVSLPQVDSQPSDQSSALSASGADAGQRAAWPSAPPGVASSTLRCNATEVVSAEHVAENTTLSRVGSLVRRVAFGGWLLGTAIMSAVQCIRLIRCRRLLVRSQPAPGWLTALVELSAGVVGVAVPQSRMTYEGCTPLVCALGQARLLWPASLSGRLDDDSRRAVVVHELAHLGRRDHWIGWLEFVASCVWWWNPLFWYVRSQLRENAELACDAWVVDLLPQCRRAYAQALIEVSQLVSWTAAPVPAVGMGNIARHSFERRLTMILRDRVPSRAPLVGLVVIGLLALGVLPGWTQPPAAEPAAQQPSATPANPTNVPSETRTLPALPDTSPPVEARSVLVPAAGDEGSSAPKRETPQLPEAVPTESAVADAAPGVAREGQLEQLEARLAQLLEEVRTLRTPQPRHNQVAFDPEAPVRSRLSAKVAHRPRANVALAMTVKRGQPENQGAKLPHSNFPHSNLPHSADVQTLTRARYRLSQDTAEAVAAFIQEWVKADVDVKVAHEATAGAVPEATPGAPLGELPATIGADVARTGTAILIVTASADDQTRIGAFIELLSPASAEPAGMGAGNGMPGKMRHRLAVEPITE